MPLVGMPLENLQPMGDIFFNLAVAGIETGFLFYQLQMISGFLKNRLEKTFSVPIIILAFFVLSAVKKALPITVPFYLLWEIILIFIQGGVLSFIQKDLNLYWKVENERTHSVHCVK